MFNSELFEISEKANKMINQEDIQKGHLENEKKVLEIIKKYSYTIDEKGMAKISVLSKNSNGDIDEYKILRSVMELGRQRYFEEEYSLYFVSDEFIESGLDEFNMITFVWDSIDYNIRNKYKTKIR